MTRKRTYGLIATFLATALLAAAVIVLAWSFGTTEGTRRLLKTISRYTPVAISAQKVEGSLRDRLQLEQVRLAFSPFEVEIERLNLRWQPWSLLSGALAARELTLVNVRIRDNTPGDRPPDLSWPRVSGMAALFGIRIERLHVLGLSYRQRNEPPFQLNTLSAAVTWRRGLLSVATLDAAAPEGRLTGTLAAGFALPSLQVELRAAPGKTIGGPETLLLTGRFHPGIGGEQLTGDFTLLGTQGTLRRLELAGEAALTKQTLRLRKLRLTELGRRGSVAGEGTVTPTAAAPLLALHLTAAGIDLAPELKIPTDLSGTLTVAGTPDAYQGEFQLSSKGKGWQEARLSGTYRGGRKGLRLSPLQLSLLSGTVRGDLALAWEKEFTLRGAIRGERLDPAGLAPGWAGKVNFALAGTVAWPEGAAPRGELKGRLLESVLHGQPLTGSIDAAFSGDDVRIGALALQGRGFSLKATGNLRERLALTADIRDLGRLIPQAAGEIGAAGWVRRRNGQTEAVLTGQGTRLAAAGWKCASAQWTARFGEGPDSPLNLSATLRQTTYGGIQADSVTLNADGTAAAHSLNMELKARQREARLSLTGSYGRGSWQGKVVRFSGRDTVGPWTLAAPAALSFDSRKVTLAPLVLSGGSQERFELSGALTLNPLAGFVQTAWNGLNPARSKPWLPAALQLNGTSSGHLTCQFLPEERLAVEGRFSLAQGKLHWRREGVTVDAALHTTEFALNWQGPWPHSVSGGADADAGLPAAERLTVTGQIAGSGALTVEGQRIVVEAGSLRLDGNQSGMAARIDLGLAGGGALKGDFSSPRPASLALPAAGRFAVGWQGVDMVLLGPWLPAALRLEGTLAGQMQGNLLPEQRLSLKGDASLAGGKIRRLSPAGEISANLRSASLSWNWQEEALNGAFTLALAEQGEGRGTFQLPLPARFPAAFDRRGPLQASLTGQVHEKGLLASLFPGLIRESRGELAAEFRIGGTWDAPTFEGNSQLSQAGAYLPTAGIQVRDIQWAMRLEKDRLLIDSFRASSGAGRIDGTAQVRLKGWQVSDFQGNIGGDRFQVLYLPEVQIMATPRLRFSGTPEKLTVRGEVQLPEMFIFGPPNRAALQPSSDVVIEGAAKPVEPTFPLALDVQVRLNLGEKVQAKLEGIDAQLGGGIDLQFPSLDKIASRGEIKVVKGRYRAYGVDLEIVRGRLFYSGGPLNQPTLDILALRTIDDVKAGITAGGILRSPIIKLYSEPAMPEVDILSYIVFGHPMSNSSSQEQAGMMAQAAGVLLSKGKSALLQEQIKNRLGLSTLEFQSGSAGAAGRMGYKEIPSAPTGAAAAGQAASVSQTMLTVGKYLTPRLYFSYGRSLFTGGNLFRLRYDLFKQWQIETQTGTESGVDLYYRIDFN
ncbi:MAG: translocation/assembly module TamB domain-containing protein [Deltaproteobacteria bacterium]|nr:translocation/assembly module TamB domain-containing protein [Deltaproteobacteria bacterium]